MILIYKVTMNKTLNMIGLSKVEIIFSLGRCNNFWVNSHRYIPNPSKAHAWIQGYLLNIPVKCINFRDPLLVFFWVWRFCVAIMSLTHMLPAWALALTLYMFTFIHIDSLWVWVVSSNYFGLIQIYFKLEVLRVPPEPPVLLMFATLTFLLNMFTLGIMSVFYLIFFPVGFSDIHHGHNKTAWDLSDSLER